MRVTENLKLRCEIMKTLTGERFTPKTFSITRLIQCPRKTYYIMTGTKMMIQEAGILYMTRGRGIGTEIQKHFSKIEVEVRLGDIRGDIDAVGELNTEIYSTNMSSKSVKDETKVPEVLKNKVRQLMSYCYMTGKNKGNLVVFFNSGDYSRFTDVFGKKVYTGIQPELKSWTLEFTEEELEENWKKILYNKAEIELALKTGIPPFISGEDFECRNCGFNYTCLGEEPVTEPVEELK
jgi:CRISPR/Cas system-associated exonuclease Cas4 (RecB family)